MSLWMFPLLVLVVEVNGSMGQQPLSCLGSPEEGIVRRDHKSPDIFWKKNGVEEAQRGNLYFVQLEESLGGGNYTCHRKDGSLVNHTEVLIQEDETKRKKILVKNDRGTLLFKSVSISIGLTASCLSCVSVSACLCWLFPPLEDYLKCSAQNYNGEFHCSWTWHTSRVGKVAFIKAWR